MILLFAAAALACPALLPALERAESTTTTERAAALAEALESLGCDAAGPTELGRYWAAEARHLGAAGETARAALAAAAAHRMLPPDDPHLLDVPAPAPADGTGWLVVDTNRATSRVDTVPPAAWPAEVPSGLHLLQVLSPDGTTLWYGKVVRVVAAEEVLVETGLPEASPEPLVDGALLPADLPPDEGPRRSAWWFVASGVAAGGAAGLYWLADHERGAITTAEDLPALEAAYTRQRLYAGGAVLLSAGTAFGVVGYFVF